MKKILKTLAICALVVAFATITSNTLTSPLGTTWQSETGIPACQASPNPDETPFGGSGYN